MAPPGARAARGWRTTPAGLACGAGRLRNTPRRTRPASTRAAEDRSRRIGRDPGRSAPPPRRRGEGTRASSRRRQQQDDRRWPDTSTSGPFRIPRRRSARRPESPDQSGARRRSVQPAAEAPAGCHAAGSRERARAGRNGAPPRCVRRRAAAGWECRPPPRSARRSQPHDHSAESVPPHAGQASSSSLKRSMRQKMA